MENTNALGIEGQSQGMLAGVEEGASRLSTHLAELSARLHKLEARLMGDKPMAVSGDEQKTSPDALVPRIQEILDNCHRWLDQATGSVGRLEEL